MALSLARKYGSPSQLAGKSVGTFAHQCLTFSDELGKANKGAVNKAALMMTNAIRAEIRQVVPSSKLRNMRGASIGARYDVKGEKNPTALIRALGPLQIVERDTKPHQILPKGIGRSQGRSKMARRAARQSLYAALFGGSYGSGVHPLSTPYGPRYRVNHPGTKGRHPFQKGVEKTRDKVAPVLRTGVADALRKAFG